MTWSKTRRQFYTRTPLVSFYKLRRDKHLSKLLPFLQFALYVVTHFVQVLNTLYCSPITLVKVLQIWITSFKDINRNSIWYNWEGLCWHCIFKKSLRAFSLKLRGAAFKSLTQLWYSWDERFWSYLGISVKTL